MFGEKVMQLSGTIDKIRNHNDAYNDLHITSLYRNIK